eukprot:2817541-Rhodomonas_salina.3
MKGERQTRGRDRGRDRGIHRYTETLRHRQLRTKTARERGAGKGERGESAKPAREATCGGARDTCAQPRTASTATRAQPPPRRTCSRQKVKHEEECVQARVRFVGKRKKKTRAAAAAPRERRQ